MEIELKRLLSEDNMRKLVNPRAYNFKISATGGGADISYSIGHNRIERSIADFEKNVVKEKLKKKIPAGYKMVLSVDDSLHQAYRCSIESKKRHLTLTFVYAKSELAAVAKCLFSLMKGVDIGTEIEYDHRSSKS